MILKFNAKNPNSYECELMLKFDTENFIKVETLASLEAKKVEYETTLTSGVMQVYLHPTNTRIEDSEIRSYEVAEETFYFLTSNSENFVTSDNLNLEVNH